jgi:hypothetical protein
MKNNENILDWISTISLIIVGCIGVGVTTLDLFGTNFESGPFSWFKGPTPIILLIVSLLSLAIGLERATRFKNLHRQLENIISNITDLRKITSVSPKNVVMMVDSYVGTEFDFQSMVRTATKSVFLIGPNLHYVTRNANVIKIFLDTKLKEPNFKIRFLISNPSSESICEVMGRVAYTEAFSYELKTAIEEFKQWKIYFAKNRRHTPDFVVRKADVVTMSLLFIDGEDPDHAKLILTPIPWKVEGSQRPAFILYRNQHKEAYDRYWTAYDTMFTSPTFSSDI